MNPGSPGSSGLVPSVIETRRFCGPSLGDGVNVYGGPPRAQERDQVMAPVAVDVEHLDVVRGDQGSSLLVLVLGGPGPPKLSRPPV